MFTLNNAAVCNALKEIYTAVEITVGSEIAKIVSHYVVLGSFSKVIAPTGHAVSLSGLRSKKEHGVRTANRKPCDRKDMANRRIENDSIGKVKNICITKKDKNIVFVENSSTA